MIPSLSLLNDDDLCGLQAWAEPIARMERHDAVAAWGRQAWMASVDESRRRTDGGAVTPFPGFSDLTSTELQFLAAVVAGTREAGSDFLRAFVDELSDDLIAELVSRAGSCQGGG